MMNDLIALLNSKNVWVLIPLMGMAIPITAIVFDTIRKTVQTKQQEVTRREVAAYVAEGSITPDDAEKILTAKPGGKSKKRREHDFG